METMERDALHLPPTPGSPDRFPECLRAEVERIAREIHDHRCADGDPDDPLRDWLDAEEEVLGRCLTSPARRLPGGDLFPEMIG